MNKLITSIVFALVSLPMFASDLVETPLIVSQQGQGGQLSVVINPALGTLSLYEIQGNNQVLHQTYSFLTDLNMLESSLYQPQANDDRQFNMLQLGSLNNKPKSSEVFASLPKTATKAEIAAGLSSLQVRALNGEQEFWAKPPEYDGIVRGAMGTRILAILIPIKRIMMFYAVDSLKFEPMGWRNYSSELYVPQVIESTPTPQEINNQLPAEVRLEHQKALEAAQEAAAAGGGGGGGGGGGKALSLNKSDAWIAAGSQERFLVLDSANNHIMSYDLSGKDVVLKSVRNLEIDLLIPTGFRSMPDPTAIFQALMQDKGRQKFLFDNGFLDAAAPRADLALLQAVVAGAKAPAGAGSSPIQASILADDVTVNFTKSQKIMVYRLNGANNSLELVSVRDYTIDASVAILDSEIKYQVHAAKLYKDANTLVRKNQDPAAMRTLKSALTFNPCLYKDAEADRDLSKSLGKLDDWQPTIEAAQKACEEKMKKIEERKKAAAEARERIKKLREELGGK
jgi:hypothetical protein